ncbi:hypothetical protein KC331_g11013 [Hortaea werneckii]|uniref:Uncharacterized protein n=1 Tax=Hortaea werneckii TaxID=91943 RepID=A0A3M7CES8_HORWE|nr:hypothetical protein KC331_g11013 [Hortaea werneckii]KAI7718538.1 hypothetical protein KC353_g3696 [Hortaea werneckii]RMY50638.1 hypothetical protein D0865_06788 [Hortaea werneckii]
MGICASCLGLNRHPSQDVDESDPLLDDSQPVHYGGLGGEDAAQPDDEDLSREREALEQITAEASENMIDVSQHHTFRSSQSHQVNAEADPDNAAEHQEDSEDAEEAAWLQSIQSAGLDSTNEVKGMLSGALIMDIGQLRQDAPPTSAKRTAVR